MSKSLSFPKEKIHVVLLEGVHQNAVDVFKENDYVSLEYHDRALEGQELPASGRPKYRRSPGQVGQKRQEQPRAAR